MQKMLRGWWQRTRSALIQMTELLPTLGFGRTVDPPFEPPQRSESSEPVADGDAARRATPHDQQHVHPTDTQEHGHSQR